MSRVDPMTMPWLHMGAHSEILQEWSLTSSTLSAIGDGLGLPRDISNTGGTLDLNTEDASTGLTAIQEAAAMGQRDTVSWNDSLL